MRLAVPPAGAELDCVEHRCFRRNYSDSDRGRFKHFSSASLAQAITRKTTVGNGRKVNGKQARSDKGGRDRDIQNIQKTSRGGRNERSFESFLKKGSGVRFGCAASVWRAMADFEEVLGYVEEHAEELAKLGRQSLSECLATGKQTKQREGNAERLKYYRAYRRMSTALSEEQEQRWKQAELRICASEDLKSLVDGVARVCEFFGERQETLIALQKESLMALANSGKANKDKEWNFFRNFMQRVVAAGKLPDHLHEELHAWEVILCVSEGMSVPTTQNLERGLARVYVFFEEKRDVLIALQKESLMALANSGKANKDKEWNFFRNFMQRVVAAGKLPDQLHEELHAWEVILCVSEGMSVPTTQNLERGLARVYVFFEEKRDVLIALQKESLMALANSGKANKDKEWNFFRNFMQRMVAAGKLPDQLHEELHAWEVILCVSEGMSVPTTQNLERGLARMYLFFEEKRDVLIALQKESLMALANSGKANKDKDWNFFRNFIQRVVAAGKLSEALRKELFAWESVLCAQGMSVPAALEGVVNQFIEMVEEKQGMLTGLKVSTVKELFSVHARKQDAGLRFGYDFVTRQYQKLDATQQEKVDAALRAVLWSKEQVPLKVGTSRSCMRRKRGWATSCRVHVCRRVCGSCMAIAWRQRCGP